MISSRVTTLGLYAATASAVLALAGCRGQTSEDPPIMPERNMYDTERYNPESYSQFYPDHRTMRVPVGAFSVNWNPPGVCSLQFFMTFALGSRLKV